jgi:predicted dehydrogenase
MSLTLATCLVLCAAVQGPPPAPRMPPPGASATSSGTQVISPVAVMTWVTRRGHDDVHTLDLIVLWRGAPGWFMRAGTHGSSSGGSGDAFHTTIRYGDVELQLGLQSAKRTAEIQEQKVELGDANVIFVDHVDGAGGAQVVRTQRIDPVLPLSAEGRPRVDAVLRRSPEIISFLRCDTVLPDAKAQATIDRICAQVIGKRP